MTLKTNWQNLICDLFFIGEPGMWHISPSGILEMDSVSGAAFVKSPGTATVFHDIPGIGKTYREVFIAAYSSWRGKLAIIVHAKEILHVY